MKRGLQIFDTLHLDEIVARKFDMVRIDCQHETPEVIHALVREITETGLEPVVILREAAQLAAVPAGLRVEPRNEPDLEGPEAGAYADLCYQFIEVDEGQHQLFVGVVSNLNDRGFKYLKQLPWHDEAWARVGCSFHRYPDRTPEQSHMYDFTLKYPFKKYWTRDMEIEELRRIVGWFGKYL